MTAANLVTVIALRAMLDEVLPTSPWTVLKNKVLDAAGRPVLVGGTAVTPLLLRYLNIFGPSTAKLLYDLVMESMPVWSWEPPLFAGRYYARKGPQEAVHVLSLRCDELGFVRPDEDEPQQDLAWEALRGVWQWAKLPDPIDLAREGL